VVLCAWSDTFSAMLQNETWQESRKEELAIQWEDNDAFKLLLKYMYTGETGFITSENIIAVLVAANYYGVTSLKGICGEMLSRQISNANLFHLLSIANFYD